MSLVQRISLYVFLAAVGSVAGLYMGYDVGFGQASWYFRPFSPSRAARARTIPDVVAVTATYSSPERGLSFVYRTLPNGYELREIPADEPGAFGAVVLMRKSELIGLVDDPAREGPPAITLEVFQNSDDSTLDSWVASSERSNAPVGAALEPTIIGERAGLRYAWDGLYASESVVVMGDGRVYVFSYGRLADDDGYQKDFDALLKTVDFSL
jgi:hypothetical protein